MKNSSLILASLLLTVSCSKIQDMDDRTHSMEKSTKEMSKTTNTMKDTTGVMYQQLRSGDTAALRMNAMKDLLNPESGMGTKMTSACIYFKAMEFQLWTDNDLFDNAEARDAMYRDAVDEFTRRTLDIYEKVRDKKIDPTSKLTDRNNDQKVFLALAATLHMNHHFQDTIASQNSKFQTSSMYDLMKKALSKDNSKKALEDYEMVLVNGINRDMMIDLIKARVDIMSALALKNLTNKDNMTLGQKTRGLVFKVIGERLGGEIDLPEVYDQTNTATREWTEKYLDGALKAKNFLRSIGVQKSLHKTLRSAYKNIDFNEKKGVESKNKDVRKENLKTLINGLLE